MIQIDSSAELDARVFPLETPSTLDGRTDLVYTGQRALCWLHDLNAWAAVVWRLLKPGGVCALPSRFLAKHILLA
jgi:hypothetical protein